MTSLAFLINRQSQQIGARKLLMAANARSVRFECLQDAEIVRQETVHGMGEVGAQERKSIAWRQGMRGEGWIGQNADEGEFGEWARSPAFARVLSEPLLDLGMGEMGGPSRGDQHIYVEQESRVHSRPALKFLDLFRADGRLPAPGSGIKTGTTSRAPTK